MSEGRYGEHEHFWRTRDHRVCAECGLHADSDQVACESETLQERAEKAEALLRRLHGWDIMDVTSDGPYWQREIDQLLSPTQETDPE